MQELFAAITYIVEILNFPSSSTEASWARRIQSAINIELRELTMLNYTQPRLTGLTMHTAANDRIYYTAQEAAVKAGISKPTLLRWIKTKRVRDSAKRDRNGWRLFSEAEIAAIRGVAQSEK